MSRKILPLILGMELAFKEFSNQKKFIKEKRNRRKHREMAWKSRKRNKKKKQKTLRYYKMAYYCPNCKEKMKKLESWKTFPNTFKAKLFCEKCGIYYRYKYEDNGLAGINEGFEMIDGLDLDFEEKSQCWGE